MRFLRAALLGVSLLALPTSPLPTLPVTPPSPPTLPVASPSVPLASPSILPNASPITVVVSGPTPSPAPSSSPATRPGGGPVGGTGPTSGSNPGQPTPAAAVSPAPESPLETIVGVIDSPLGPGPPVLGIALVLLALLLGIRRRRHAVARSRALEAAKVGFLKVASHELRTPLTVIRGYVSMAEDGSLGELPPRLRGVLPALHGEVAQLERLVEQMLVAARLDEELLHLDRRRVDLRDVARTCLKNFPSSPGAPSRHRLVLETDRRPVFVSADAGRLGDVLGNLVDNAIRYSPDGGEVVVRVGVHGRRAHLSVSDHGLGIEKGDLGTIFSRFGRIVNAQNSHLIGAGLGLYLAREIARLHRGDIRVESKPGEGSTFTVSLPLAAPAWQRLPPVVARLARRARPAAG